LEVIAIRSACQVVGTATEGVFGDNVSCQPSEYSVQTKFSTLDLFSLEPGDQNSDFLPYHRLQSHHRSLGEEIVDFSTAHPVLFMADRSNHRTWCGKTCYKLSVFLSFLGAWRIDLIVEEWVLDMEFTWIKSYDWAYFRWLMTIALIT
jgi:hypothetical protein